MGTRRKLERQKNREELIKKRRKSAEISEEIDDFIFEISGKPVRYNPKNQANKKWKE